MKNILDARHVPPFAASNTGALVDTENKSDIGESTNEYINSHGRI